MKPIKFYSEFATNGEFLFNGVTDSFLIHLSEEIVKYSDWINSVTLSIDEYRSQDSLIIEFTDIDQFDYWCIIYQDHSFEVFNSFTNNRGESELVKTIVFSDETLSDCDNLINYLKKMPKTIFSSI